MKKIREALDTLQQDELVYLQKDLFNGGMKLRGLVAEKLREIEESETKICATCGNSINVLHAENFKLLFGPVDLKKQASFCALDCLEYFFANLKKLSVKRLNPQR